MTLVNTVNTINIQMSSNLIENMYPGMTDTLRVSEKESD